MVMSQPHSLSLWIVYAFSAAPPPEQYELILWLFSERLILWGPCCPPLLFRRTPLDTVLNYSAPKLGKLVSTKDTEESSQKTPTPTKKKENHPSSISPVSPVTPQEGKGAESSRVPGIPLNIRRLGARPLSVPFSWSPNSLRTPQGKDNQIN